MQMYLFVVAIVLPGHIASADRASISKARVKMIAIANQNIKK